MDPEPRHPGFPMDLADRCVKCGLCLPHCPTYRLAGVEGESPRGRIALMQGLATGRLAPDAALVDHLGQCLACRACEQVCPAGVPYGELLDAGRAMLVESAPAPEPAYRALLRRPRLAGLLAGIASATGLARLGARLPGLPGRALALLPPRARGFREPRRAAAGPRGEVLLFAGCVGRIVDGRTLEDALTVLRAAGFAVRVPARQGCCGAMDQHGGRPAEAARLAAANLEAFAGQAPVVTCATGCAATLAEYGRIVPRGGGGFASRVRDVAEVLADAELPLRAGPYRRIALHVPCTQRNVTGSGDATRRLLARLPGLEVQELPDGCCGAAGEMFLRRPGLSDALLEPLLDALPEAPLDAVVTSNVGCMMHLAAGLARRGRSVPVIHPVTVVARALAPAAV